MSKYKLVIFDMDGTLADTSPGILNSIRYVQSRMGLPEITSEQMYSHIGPPMEESYSRNFGLSGDSLKQAVELHKEYALQQGHREIRWYDGIPELMDSLKNQGISTAVATLKAQTTMEKILEHFDMTDKFDMVFGADPSGKRTKAQLLKLCLESSGIPREQAVLIGDSSYDAIGAAEAGIDFIAVTYGFGFISTDDVRDYLCVAVCADTGQLESFLKG